MYLRQHLRRYTVLSLCLILLSAMSFIGASGRQKPLAQQAADAAPSVEVTRFVPAISEGQTRLFRLAFNYDFPGRTRVVVAGFGEVPAKGSLSYLTPERTLVFEDKCGAILKQVALTITGTPEGAGSKIPAPGDFPPEFNSYHRAGTLSSEHCDAILNEFFESGYLPRPEQGLTVYTTTYQNIKEAPEGKVARFALQITSPFPSADNSGRSSFRVQMIVQERGILSPKFAQEVSAQTTEAANRRRNEIVTRLSQ